MRSPNCDARPRGAVLSLIVIHGISLPPGQFGGRWIDRLFANDLPADADPYFATIQGLTVSAHVLIDRAGALTQYVPFHRRAWHAGKSAYCGRTACNDFSVGIELEGADDVPYARRQYRSLVAVIRALQRAYPTLRHAPVVGHSDIVARPQDGPWAVVRLGILRRFAFRREPRRRQRCHSVSAPPCARASRRAMTNSKSESRFRYRVSCGLNVCSFAAAHDAAFRAPTNRTREMTNRRGPVAAGQDEFLQRRQLGIQRVELRLELCNVLARRFSRTPVTRAQRQLRTAHVGCAGAQCGSRSGRRAPPAAGR